MLATTELWVFTFRKQRCTALYCVDGTSERANKYVTTNYIIINRHLFGFPISLRVLFVLSADPWLQYNQHDCNGNASVLSDNTKTFQASTGNQENERDFPISSCKLKFWYPAVKLTDIVRSSTSELWVVLISFRLNIESIILSSTPTCLLHWVPSVTMITPTNHKRGWTDTERRGGRERGTASRVRYNHHH